jgi:hypothetical protein
LVEVFIFEGFEDLLEFGLVGLDELALLFEAGADVLGIFEGVPVIADGGGLFDGEPLGLGADVEPFVVGEADELFGVFGEDVHSVVVLDGCGEILLTIWVVWVRMGERPQVDCGERQDTECSEALKGRHAF